MTAAATPTPIAVSTAPLSAFAFASASMIDWTTTTPVEVMTAPDLISASAVLKSMFSAAAADAPTAPFPVPIRPALMSDATVAGMTSCSVWRLSTSAAGTRLIGFVPASASS